MTDSGGGVLRVATQRIRTALSKGETRENGRHARGKLMMMLRDPPAEVEPRSLAQVANGFVPPILGHHHARHKASLAGPSTRHDAPAAAAAPPQLSQLLVPLFTPPATPRPSSCCCPSILNLIIWFIPSNPIILPILHPQISNHASHRTLPLQGRHLLG